MSYDKKKLIELRDKVKAGEDFKMGEIPDSLQSDDWGMTFAAAYNGSLDASRALHDAVLPGYGWAVTDRSARIWVINSGFSVAATAPVPVTYNNPARAWLIAILEALISEDGQ